MNDFFTGVPFSGVENKVESLGVIGTREDECLGIAVGAWLTGKIPLVYMQNSGLGNCFDILTSLLIPYGITIELLINNRKEPEHHKYMGLAIYQLLGAIRYDAFTMC